MSRHGDLVLAVDLGTGGPKVGFVTMHGRIIWWEHTTVATRLAPHGVATQDAEDWWWAVTASVRRGLAAGVDGQRVRVVSITGQWASTVPVDAAGHPVGPCLLWSDTQGAPYSRARVAGPVQGYAARPLAAWLRHSGGIPSTSGADPVGHMLHLQHDADVLARTRWFLEPVDHLTMRFTGVPAASHASMTAAWLTDNRHLDRLEYDARLVALAGVDAHRLPPLVPTGSVVGTVRPDVAAELGISPSAVAVTGMPDLHSAATGAGAVRLGEPHVSIGTTSWISAPVPHKKTDVVRQMAAVPGLTNDSYLLANNQESAGRCLQWWHDLDGGSYDELLAAAATAEAGAGGVVFTPWLTGERSPVDDRCARAGFHNLDLAVGRGHLTRAVLEGVALNLRWLLAGSERFVGGRLDDLRLVGGGARSDLWCQVLADVLDRTVVRVTDPWLAGLRGAALIGSIGVGEVRPDEVSALVATDAPFVPTPAHRATYDTAYAEFPGLYAAQRKFFRRRNPVG